MELGTSFSFDWLTDLGALRDAAQGLDEAAVDYVTTAGHVLTTSAGRYPERPLPTYALPYRDPFVLFAHLGGATRRLRFRTGIVILPLLPTALVAKQAADLSLCCDGRFELGVGISWQEAEYRALGQEVHTRGRRMTEQIEVLRLLWSSPTVTFRGRFHDLDDVGIGQLPATPVPIWIGCTDRPDLLARAGAIADGWLPLAAPADRGPADALAAAAQGAGRPTPVPIAGRLLAGGEAEALVAEARRQVEVGCTALTIAPPTGAAPAAGVEAVIATRDLLLQAFADG
jgi:alkanesulfonate monooxygenase SsuD/methylene tetrahydromethanopterin reductase-like flavin-dependent oxidoreductase (luciferase family)